MLAAQLMKITAPLIAMMAVCIGTAMPFDSVVVINEIQYNAPVGQTEWIELRNLQGVDVNVAGWSINGGIDYTLPASGAGSFIPGGGYLVIAANPALLAGSIGPFTGQLDNGGETIRLRNLNGRIMDEVSYDDEGEWPVGADGSGATLARRDAAAASGAEAWAASMQLGGTPGAQNFPANAPVVRTHIATRSTWKYRDTDAAPAADWNASAYSDAAWTSGAAALGTQPAITSLTVTANLVERFRASDITGVAEGETVTTWTDAATDDGVSQNASAGSTTPTYRAAATANGKPAVRFDGNDELRTTTLPGINSTGGFVYFVVCKANATQTNGLVTDGAGSYLFDRSLTGAGTPLVSLKAVSGRYGLQKRYDANTGLGGPLTTSSISTTAFQIVAVRRNRTLGRFELWVDGVMEGTEIDTGAALTPDPIDIGRHATAAAGGFVGDIAELLIYKDGLTDVDFQRVGMYLEAEYGLNTAFQIVATTLSSTAPVSYFRQSFNFPGDQSRTILRLNQTVADGAVFYLNGAELSRANMPAGAVNHSTAASSIVASPVASGFVEVPSTALVNGTNVLAVSLHKAAGSTATYFDAALESIEMPVNPTTAGQLRFHEIAGAGDAAFFVELENISGAALSASGWTIKASTGQTVSLPAQSLAPGGLLTLDAAALGFTPEDGMRLYLFAPGGTLLRDAREVTNRLRGLTGNGVWGHPTTATPGGANIAAISNNIVINEIFYHAIDDGPEQWIELHNKGAAAVDISGWKFTDGVGFDFPAATSIPADGYLVVAWNPAAFAALHPAVTALGPWTGSLSGAGELLTLRDANDNIADQVRYADSGRWSPWADGGGSSLELKDPDADNNTGEAWDSSDESLATPWQSFSYTGVAAHATTNSFTYYNEFLMGLLDDGEILIDDVSVKEVSMGDRELIQNGTFSGGTAAGWRTIGTHKLSTVVDDPFTPGEKVLKVVGSGATEHMNNHCETTLKAGSTYVTITTGNTYTISFRAKWLHGTNRLHTRLYFNRLVHQTLLNRPATGGTPGAVNSRRLTNIGPTFSSLSVLPVVPLINQPATVRIGVSDPDGIALVELLTSVNGAAFSAASMISDGGGWTAPVPGQASGTQVQFYIRATDGSGAVSTYPAGATESRAMIPWEDGRTQLVMPSGARPHNIRVVMPAADANNTYLAENVQSNFYRPCTVILDDTRAWYQAGVRLKSSEHGRFQQNRVGFNLKFGSDDLFLGAHATISVDRSGNKTTEGLDGTGITSQREIIVKQVMNAAGGIYSMEDDLIRVIPPVAAGTPAPLFTGAGALGEAILSKSRFDDEYLDAQWDSGGSGPLFKQEYIYPLNQTIDPVTRAVATIAAAGTLAAVAENPKVPQTGGSPGPTGINVLAYTPPAGIDAKENYRWHWLIKNARAADDFTGLIASVTAVGQAQGSAAFKTQTEAALDVDTWLRAVVVPQMFGVTDNYLGNGSTHNFILYYPPGQKGVAIPWDCDYLAQSSSAASFTTGGNITKFIADGANKRRYYCHVLDILNRTFNDAFLTRWATHYSTFGVDDMTTSLTYLRSRATYIRNVVTGSGGQIAPIAAVPFSITTAGPLTVSTPFATIAGDGWIDVDSIRLQGSTAPLATTWTDENSYTLQLPVNAGTVTYTLEAVRKDGSVAGTASITVTGSGGIFPAGPNSLVISELNYNPPGSEDLTEFVELLNITGATLDLTGCHFDEESGQGIAFTFPSGVTVPAGGRILVIRDAAAFAAAYPAAGPVAPGVFTGALDNGGETLVLYAASGVEILRTTYNDSAGGTDGGGYSLVRVLGSTPDPASTDWRASMTLGGNPGSSDALLFAGNPPDDADGDNHSALIEYSFGTSDSSYNPATDFIQPNGTLPPTWHALPNADSAIISLESSNDLATWSATATSPIRRYWRLRVTLR